MDFVTNHFGKMNLRAVAMSENLRGLVVLDGDNVSPLVEIGLTDLPKSGSAMAPPGTTPLVVHGHAG